MKKNIYLFLIAFLSTIVLNSCKGKHSLAAANEHFNKKEYASAADNYEGVYSEVPKKEKGEVAFKAAECYRKNNDYKRAERWYEKAEKGGYGDEATLKKAEMIKSQEKYADAIVIYNAYLKKNPNDAEAAKQKLGADSALIWKELKSRYHVENLRKVNTSNSDYGPTLTKDALIFTSDRPDGVSKKQFAWTGGMFSDLYEAPRARRTDIIGTPSLLKGTANTNLNDGASATNDRGNTMYVTQCGGLDSKNEYSTCQIYVSNKKGKDWDPLVMLPFCDTAHNYGHPSLSADGNKLYFTSDMPGGVGGHDIYVINVSKRGKQFGDPINLGPTINTDRDEMFPFISENEVLYFSSNGHVGMGGLDIFTSKGAGTEWSVPKNLRSPMNTGGDDFAVITKDATEEKGFLSSNRTGSKGNSDDIYEFYMTPLILTLSGIARDCDTKEPIKNAIVTLKSAGGAPVTIITDSRGYYKTILAPETAYDIVGEKSDEFYQPSKNFYPSTKGIEISTDLIQDLDLCRQPFSFNVRGILYDLDKANIREDAAKILDDSVITVLKRFPTITLELGSHTDCRASADYNRALAQRRADSAVAYLVSRGIAPDRLVAKGYGEDSLFIKKCACGQTDERRVCSEEEHQLNRRTTIRILSTNYSNAAMRAQDSLDQLKINQQIKDQKEKLKEKEEQLKLTPEQLKEKQKQEELDRKKQIREDQIRKRMEEQEKKRKDREDAVKKRQEEQKKKQEDRRREMEEKRKQQQKK